MCVEFHTHEGDPSLTTLQTIRVRIGGGVKPSQVSPERVTYPLLPPGGEFEQEWRYQTNQGRPTAPEIRVASQVRWLASLSIERRKDQSALFVEVFAEGRPVFMSVALKGGPDLFPSFDIPSALPPLSAYREATVSEGKPEKIDAIDLCGSH